MAETNVLIQAIDLKKYFPVKSANFTRGLVKAVDGVSLSLERGETLGLVGESGCGKTTFGRSLIRLLEPTAGKIIYDGQDISQVDMLPYRRKMQIIFQDPYASLDPRMTVGDIVGEALYIHKLYSSSQEKREKVCSLLHLVGLNKEHANRFPHEFSGGQRQRIGIARALAVNPEFIVCDEPISALDVSIQAQIINMLSDLQQERGLTYLFIAHDLSVVKHISNRIGVMYLGNLVELAESRELCQKPIHPYTQTLLSAVPVADPRSSRSKHRIVLQGEIPSPMHPPKGCPFHTRCPLADAICKEEKPQLKEVSSKHFSACHHPEKI